MKINETINIKIPYTEKTYGTLYIQCIKDKGQTDAEFLNAVLVGDRDPLTDNCSEEWKATGSDHLVINVDDLELATGDEQ